MTLILFLSLGNSKKSIPSEGLIKGLCSELYAAGVKSGYGGELLILVSFLPCKQSSLAKVKNQHYVRFTHVL